MRILFVLYILLLSCDSPEKIDAGTVEGRDYINVSYGLKITLPDGWSVISDHETMKLNGGGSDYKVKWESARAKALVVAYKFADADTKGASGINSNISVYTEYISPRSDVQSAKDYIPFYKKALDKHEGVKYRYIKEENALVTNNEHTEVLDMEFDVLGNTVRKKSFLFLYGKQLLNISLTWEKGKTKIYNELVESYRSIHLIETKLTN